MARAAHSHWGKTPPRHAYLIRSYVKQHLKGMLMINQRLIDELGSVLVIGAHGPMWHAAILEFGSESDEA
jgi:hypothetical protein